MESYQLRPQRGGNPCVLRAVRLLRGVNGRDGVQWPAHLRQSHCMHTSSFVLYRPSRKYLFCAGANFSERSCLQSDTERALELQAVHLARGRVQVGARDDQAADGALGQRQPGVLLCCCSFGKCVWVLSAHWVHFLSPLQHFKSSKSLQWLSAQLLEEGLAGMGFKSIMRQFGAPGHGKERQHLCSSVPVHVNGSHCILILPCRRESGTASVVC